MNHPVDEALARFGLKSLFPSQRLVIQRLLDHEALRQAVVLPTGAGKSLCFQLPALLFPHPTLVVYPLRSLMADQKRRCLQAGLSTQVLQGGQTKAQRAAVWDALEKGGVHLVLSNPETLEQPEVQRRLAELRFSHAVIDEAHCVELWGTRFRPGYRRLGEALAALQVPRITAFTATASPRIAADWRDSLFGGQEFELIRASADRPNLDFSHEAYFSLRKSLPRLLLREARPAVVFSRSRDQVRRWAQHLHRTTALDVRFYHAGLTRDEKTAVEEWFFASNDGVLVATNAYGMGVDKPNIRTVVHLERPQDPEDYLQEAGRAGRDGAPARAIALVPSQATMPPSRCRRATLLEALGDEAPVCSGCDVCRGQDVAPPEDLGPALARLAWAERRLDRDECRAFLAGRRPPSLWDSDLPLRPGWGLWKEEDDLTVDELWKGLERGQWVRFSSWGPWKGLLVAGSSGGLTTKQRGS